MGVKDTVKTAIAEMSGNIEKAIIEIVDMRAGEVQLATPVSVQASNSFAGLGGLNMARDNMIEIARKAGALTEGSAVSNAAAAALKGLQERSELINATTKRFVVQFNPSELSFSGFGGGLVSKSNYDNGGSGISFEPMKVRINMTVKLIFDQVDPQDAFLQDKLAASPTSVALGFTKIGMNLSAQKAGKTKITVQNQVEGFIAALRSTSTRIITFHWGKLNYPGILNRVTSQYTMFNVLGEPIRGVVTLSLVCADEDISSSSMGIWQSKFNEAFGVMGADGTFTVDANGKSYVKTSQKVGSLLNFNL